MALSHFIPDIGALQRGFASAMSAVAEQDRIRLQEEKLAEQKERQRLAALGEQKDAEQREQAAKFDSFASMMVKGGNDKMASSMQLMGVLQDPAIPEAIGLQKTTDYQEMAWDGFRSGYNDVFGDNGFAAAKSRPPGLEERKYLEMTRDRLRAMKGRHDSEMPWISRLISGSRVALTQDRLAQELYGVNRQISNMGRAADAVLNSPMDPTGKSVGNPDYVEGVNLLAEDGIGAMLGNRDMPIGDKVDQVLNFCVAARVVPQKVHDWISSGALSDSEVTRFCATLVKSDIRLSSIPKAGVPLAGGGMAERAQRERTHSDLLGVYEEATGLNGLSYGDLLEASEYMDTHGGEVAGWIEYKQEQRARPQDTKEIGRVAKVDLIGGSHEDDSGQYGITAKLLSDSWMSSWGDDPDPESFEGTKLPREVSAKAKELMLTRGMTLKKATASALAHARTPAGGNWGPTVVGGTEAWTDWLTPGGVSKWWDIDEYRVRKYAPEKEYDEYASEDFISLYNGGYIKDREGNAPPFDQVDYEVGRDPSIADGGSNVIYHLFTMVNGQRVPLFVAKDEGDKSPGFREDMAWRPNSMRTESGRQAEIRSRLAQIENIRREVVNELHIHRPAGDQGGGLFALTRRAPGGRAPFMDSARARAIYQQTKMDFDEIERVKAEFLKMSDDEKLKYKIPAGLGGITVR